MAGGVPDRKLEFAVVTIVVCALLAFLLDALDDTRQEVEEAAVQAEIAALRIELLDRLAHREGFGGTPPASDNPVVWAGRRPTPYVGEVDTPESAVGRGIWFYAQDGKTLVYRFHSGEEWRYRLTRSTGGDSVAVLGGIGLARVGPATGTRPRR
ncbi:MAG: hypothetical protein RBT86_03595 [Azospira sp.]|jgi:hypothetical protein|nr:hypothetical protein [Azospira sp.]